MNKKSLFFAAAGMLIAAAGLSAEPAVTAHIPFAFTASSKTLPAGDYTIEPVGAGVVIITGANSSDHAFLLFTESPTSGKPGLTFDRTGAKPTLTGVRTSEGTWVFITAPAAKAATAVTE